MLEPFNKLAKILHIKPEALLDLSEKISSITDQEKVIERIAGENELLVHKILSGLGLSKENSAQEIRSALQAKIIDLEKKLASGWQGLCKTALSLVEELSFAKASEGTAGFFIKREKAVELLGEYPPQNLLDFFGYKNVRELVDKESFESVFSALRFTQSTEWMHKFFDEAYSELKADDFEERPIQIKVLEEKWLNVADPEGVASRPYGASKFLEKKYHNVSHLKEFGIIFIVPLKLDTPGETLRIFTLLLHYLNEVPFYSKLFKRFSQEPDFVDKLKSLLRGDVLEGPLPNGGGMSWRIVQRYLAKDDENDFRLFEPHINPEAEHWFKAQENLAKLGPDFEFWKDLDFVGDYFGEELVSFNLVDLVMTLVKKGEIKYLYHQQEALWNRIFIEYLGRDRMNALIEKNIIRGYIQL